MASYRMLSSRNADSSTSNSQWTNTIDPIVLNDGDVFDIKSAYINSLQQANSDIAIPNDVECTITFGMYQTYCDKPTAGYSFMPRSEIEPYQTFSDQPDYQKYISMFYPIAFGNPLIFKNNEGRPNIFTRTFTIPKGTYNAPELAQVITDSMSTPANVPDPFCNLSYAYWSPNYHPVPLDIAGQKLMQAAEFPSPRSYSQFCQAKSICNFDIAYDGFNVNTLLTYAWKGKPDTLIGSQQFAVIYDDATGRFGFDSIHTPIFNGGDECTYLDTSLVSPPSTDFVMAATQWQGLYLCALDPPEFWNLLGDFSDYLIPQALEWFNKPLDEYPLDPAWVRGVFQNFDSKITGAMISIVNLADVFYGTIDGGFYCKKIKNTTLWGKNLITGRDNAFFKIALTFPINSDYKEGSAPNPSVFAIVGKQYMANEFITGYSDCSLSYLHKGDPITISSFDVSIINSSTDLPDTSIGNNNSVLVSIMRGTGSGEKR